LLNCLANCATWNTYPFIVPGKKFRIRMSSIIPSRKRVIFHPSFTEVTGRFFRRDHYTSTHEGDILTEDDRI